MNFPPPTAELRFLQKEMKKVQEKVLGTISGRNRRGKKLPMKTRFHCMRCSISDSLHRYIGPGSAEERVTRIFPIRSGSAVTDRRYSRTNAISNFAPVAASRETPNRNCHRRRITLNQG